MIIHTYHVYGQNSIVGALSLYLLIDSKHIMLGVGFPSYVDKNPNMLVHYVSII